jgi:hypothetical protein
MEPGPEGPPKWSSYKRLPTHVFSKPPLGLSLVLLEIRHHITKPLVLGKEEAGHEFLTIGAGKSGEHLVP